MSTTVNSRPPRTLQQIVALAYILIGIAIIVFASTGAADSMQLHVLMLVAIGVCAYSWMIFSFSANLIATLVLTVLLFWVWGVNRSALIGFDLIAFVILVWAAAFRERKHFRNLQYAKQILEDIDEELSIKKQTMDLSAQTRQSLQKKHDRYAQLQTIAAELTGLMDLELLSQLAVEKAFSLIGKSDVCLLFLVDAERQELSLYASQKRQSIASIRTKHGDQFDRHVLRTHRPLFVNDVRRDFRFTVNVSQKRRVNSVIACPLIVDRSVVGVLRLDSAQVSIYTQDDLRFLDIFLDLISTAMANSKLFQETQKLAVTDGLTDLMLRRPFQEFLAREITRSSRSQDSISLIMLDVDYFKRYNDTFGHIAGDHILKSVAHILRKVVPSDAVITRYGGEEFAVMLPKTKLFQGSEVAEKIREAIETDILKGIQITRLSEMETKQKSPVGLKDREQGERTQGIDTGITVSLGVAAFAEDAKAEWELIRIADQRMYQAKRSGRNLVCAS